MGVKVQGQWRHLAARIAIFGLILRAVMAAVMLPMPLMMASLEASPLNSGPALICTGTGFKLVSVDENGNLVEKDLSGHGCPVCDALAVAAFGVEAAQANIAASVSHAELLQPANEHVPASFACLAHNNRGPPHFG